MTEPCATYCGRTLKVGAAATFYSILSALR